MTRVIIRLVALTCLLFLMVPLIVIIGTSLTETSYLAFPPQGWTWKWYSTVLGDATYLHSFMWSTALAACATFLGTVIAIPVSLATTRYEFRLKPFLTATMTAPMVLPYLVLGSALLQFTGYLGFSQTFWALLVGHLLIVTPFIYKSLVTGSSAEALRGFEQASADLGASPWSTFRLITLPLLREGLISGAIFGFIISWINVELSMFNTTAVLNTIPVQLFNYVQYSVDPSIAAVSAITIFVSIAVIVVLDLTVGLDVFSSKQNQSN